MNSDTPICEPALYEDRETVVSANSKSSLLQAIRDLNEYRELFWAFVVRDVKVRYKQTALGVVWVVMQPLLMGGLFAIVFSLIRGGGGQGLSEILFFMAGLVPWMAFASGLNMASMSMETNANMITKIYFSRLVIPGAHVFGSTLDFLISYAVFLLLTAVAGQFSSGLLVAMPLLLCLQQLTALGFGLVLSILNAQYRDVKYAIPFLLQTGMFVVVPLALSDWNPFWIREIIALFPMTAVIETYRLLLIGKPLDWMLLAKGALMAILLLHLSLRFFIFRERKLVDIL